MGTQEKVQQQAKPTRRQLAARKRAEEAKKAKAWLASRKGSKTPATDKLIAKWVVRGCTPASATEMLKSHCLTFTSAYSYDNEREWVFADSAAAKLSRFGFSSDRNAFADAVAVLQEMGAPEQYWKDCKTPFAA